MDINTGSIKNKYLIVLSFLCIFICLCVPALAINNTPVIAPPKIIDLIGGGHTPPVAYIGEYVDLSKVVGWSGQIAFWYSGYPSNLQKPDIIIDASSFQHRFWIDPAKFKAGMWYKWDGEYEDSSNNEAFEVKDGIRPVAMPTEVAANFTGITPIVTAVPYEPSDVHILIARGDQIEYPYWNPNEKQGYLWLFGKTQSILGYKMDSPEIGSNIFKFPFGEEITENLETGWYTGYMQFCNKRPDVIYNESENILDTPYDDAIIPDIHLAGYTTDRIKAEFEKLEKNTAYTDDRLVNVTLEIKDPSIQFTDYYEADDVIIIQGKSTLAVGTNISFIVDPSRYTAGYSTSSHTVWATLTGNIKTAREFTVNIPINWDEMAIGGHEVVATVNKLKIHLVQKKEFDTTSIWVNPAPTLITEKVIVEDGGWHRVNTSIRYGATPTPQIIYVNSTPKIVYVYVTPSVNQNVSVTAVATAAQPGIVSTTALPAGVRTTTPPEETPISPIIAIGALVVIAAYVLIKKD